jgi:anti-sigma factor RsiW
MSHHNFKHWLENYAEQRLPAAMAQDVEQHLAICAECREHLRTIRLTRSIVKASRLEETPVPTLGFAQKVRQAIEQRRDAYVFWNPLRLVAMKFVPAVAALALGIALFAYMEITATLRAQKSPAEPLLESSLEQSAEWSRAEVAVYSDKIAHDQEQIVTTLFEGQTNPDLEGKEPK